MKLKFKLLLGALAVLAILLSACDKREDGPDLSEAGEVYDTCFVPKGHGSGTGVGFSTSGEMVTSSSDVSIPARFAIVFKCQHGKFVIDGDRGEALYKRLSKGDRVKITYYEEFSVDKHGTRTFVDMHFRDAQVTELEK